MIQTDTATIINNFVLLDGETQTATTTKPITIQSWQVNCKDDSDVILYCGSNIVIESWRQEHDFGELNYICQNDLTIYSQKKNCNVITNILPYNIKTATNIPAEIFVGGISYGDILIGFFVLLLITGSFFGGLLNRIWGVKHKKTFNNDLEYIPEKYDFR